MKKTLSNFLILISIFLVSCENPLSKSIFEPLPLEIIQKQSLQDSTFISEYEYIRKLADSVFISKSVSPQYSSLEYSDFFDFYEKENKEILHLPLIKQSRLSVMPIDSKSWKIICKMGRI